MDNDDIDEEFAVEEHQIEPRKKKTRPAHKLEKIKITDKNSNYD